MMHPFFLLILLCLPRVDTTVNNTRGLDSSTSGLNNTIEPRQWHHTLTCSSCSVVNTFNCASNRICPYHERNCATLAIRVNSRELSVYKTCTDKCSFVYKEHYPGPTFRRLPRTTGFYYVLCCRGQLCNHKGPTNVERDLMTEEIVEETVIERAVCLEEFNLLLLLSLASIFSSCLLT